MIKNTSLSSNKSQAGFSLVELMVVVAIIGALAMVAVPRVNRFIAKARTSEAQVNLGSLYTFNKNFFVEFQGYTTSLLLMGYAPEGNLRYNVGFGAAAAAAPAQYLAVRPALTAAQTAGITTMVICPVTAGNMAAGQICRSMPGSTNANPPALAAASTVPAGNATFIAGARAVIANGNACGATGDEWSMNENKSLINVCDGTL